MKIGFSNDMTEILTSTPWLGMTHNSSLMVCGAGMIIIGSLVLQAFARPYKDKLIDLCETVSLLSTLIIFQAGMVWSMNEEVCTWP